MSAEVLQTKPPIGVHRPSIIPTGGHGKGQMANIDPKTNSLINLDILGDLASLPGGNVENRGLEEELGMHRKKLLKCQSEIESLQEKTDALWRHMNNVRLDMTENQNLLRAKTSALETEQNLKQAAKEQSQKVVKELKKLETELKDKQAKYDHAKAMLEKQRKNLENIKKNQEVDKDQFQSIVDEIVDADDLNVTIQKYMILDEKTMGELTAKLGKLSDQLSAKTRDLEGVSVEMRAVEMALTRANADFQQEQNERNRLLQQWEQAMDLLRKRDADMESVRKQGEELRSEEYTWRETLLEKEMEVRDQQATETELQRNIGQLDQQLARLKSELVKRETDLQLKRDRLVTVKALLNNEKSALKTEAAQIAQLTAQVEKNTKKLTELGQQKSEKLKQLNFGKTQTETLDGAKAQLHKEFEQVKSKMESLERNKRTLTSQITKKKEQIANGRKMQKDLQHEFESMKTSNRNLTGKAKQIEKQCAKQREIVDTKDGEIKRLENQLTVLTSARSVDAPSKEDQDLIALRQKLETKKGMLMEKEATEQTWMSTIKISQGEMEKAKKQLDKMVLTRRELDSVKGVHESEITILEKRFKKLMEQKQDALAQSNLLEAEIKRLQDVLENKTAEVSNVGEAKEAQETALKAQDQQLKQRKYELQMKYLQAEEERKKINMRLNDIQSKINLLTTRYDALIRGLPALDESSSSIELATANKQAKERAEMQKVHEELTSKLVLAEKELAALQNTMKLIGERNQTFRQALVQADRNSAEYQEKFQLERQYQALSDRYRDIRQKIKTYQDQMKSSKDRSIDMEHKLIQLDIDTKRGEEEIDRLKSEISDQQNKLERWQSQNEKMQSDFERVCSAKKRSFFQEDIDLRSTIAINSAASKALSELTREFPELDGLVSNFCLKTGLELESPSDSGIGSALTRRSTMPTRPLKNGHVHMNMTKKIDTQTLPPIAPKSVRTGGVPAKLRSHSLNRNQPNRQTATIV